MTDEISTRVVALLAEMGKTDVPLDLDLVISGTLDSFGFLEFVDSLEREFDVEVDFSRLDPERFTTLEGLIEALADATGSDPAAP